MESTLLLAAGRPDLIAALGWALLHFVWQGLLVGLAAGLLLALMRGASPRRRYAVCALALFTCLALPLLHLAWLLGPSGAVPAALAASPDWLQELQALQTQLPALVMAWTCGVGLMALRLGLGLAWVARLRRQALAAAALSAVPVLWQARCQALARRLGLRRPVRLSLLPTLSGPLTLGCWRPLVLLPTALLSGMPMPLLEALLAHELAHVRRWDYLANLLQSLVEALLFFHPVVWWLSARLRAEREQVADELAAEALGDPRRLAQALHALSLITASPPTPNRLALSARGGHLFQRIERLLSPQPQTTSWKLALPALLLACTSLLVQARNHPQGSPQDPVAPLAPHAAQPVQPVAHAKPAAAASGENGESGAGALLRLRVNARHALVLDEASGRIVLEKDADAIVPIASLTKLMTAMVLLDARLDPEAPLRIAAEDVDRYKHSASRVPVGAEMSRMAALKLALLSSDNRAAAALARTYPGGNSAFAQAMQRKIAALGLTRTAIIEPTGLSPANTSTATEVAKIVAAAAQYRDIAQITSGRQAQVPINGRAREWHNTNRLVGGKGWDIRLSKTGYTEEAGRCLTMRLKSGEKNFTVVLLDADGPAQRLRDAGRIRQSLAKLPA